MKLALGTVQFGLDYGISNKQGQVDKAQVADILTQAANLGIDTLDCAGAYGNSEQVIGAQLSSLAHQAKFTIVSKIPALHSQSDNITEHFEQTLTDLQVENIDTLLFHHADNILFHPNRVKIFQQLEALKAQQKVKRIGASLYSPEQLIAISEQYTIDIAQVPLNIFDQRFITNDILTLCQQKHIKLHARSLFLQGLLLIEVNELASYFSPFKDKIDAFTSLADYLGCSRLALALSIVPHGIAPSLKQSADEIIEKVVVGVCSSEQLIEIVTAYQHAKELSISTEELQSLADNRLEFINPSLWKI
ncbi:MAG: aldo/keto reductase [Colwellia sp.]|nr:aldo/keto reductase [Colwellia sp.]MCW8863843.1 aldo/keto reductase [Colwellia sp.]MCW9081125.1 aldo/keto reductase [Colwellia sp.]